MSTTSMLQAHDRVWVRERTQLAPASLLSAARGRRWGTLLGAPQLPPAAKRLPGTCRPLCASHQPISSSKEQGRAGSGNTGAGSGVRVQAVAAPVAAPQPPAQQQPEPAKAPARYDWFGQWYPVFFVKDLDAAKPNKFTLMELPLVIWKAGDAAEGDESQGWRVFLDACPHRLVPLSEGRITSAGCLECPYHGWTFESQGKCTSIPQGGDLKNPRTAATSFPCVVRQGMLFVMPTPADQLASPPNPDKIPVQPEVEDPSWTPPIDMFRDLPYDYASLLENVLDSGHVPFTHHGTVSRRETSGLYDMKVTEFTPTGFRGEWPTGPRDGKWGPQSTEYVAPTYMRHTLATLPSFQNITSVYATPVAPGKCRLFVRNQLKFGSPLPGLVFKLLPDWMTHVSNHTVLEDDQIFLHKGEELAVARGMGERPMAQVYHMPGASDAFVVAFRNWIDREAGGGPFGHMDKKWLQAAGERLPQKQLLERFHSHTENCKSCSKALAQVASARWWAKALAAACVVGFAIAASWAAAGSGAATAATAAAAVDALKATSAARVAAGLLAAAAALGLLARKLATTQQSFLEGSYPPPRNTKP